MSNYIFVTILNEQMEKVEVIHATLGHEETLEAICEPKEGHHLYYSCDIDMCSTVGLYYAWEGRWKWMADMDYGFALK